MSKQKIIRPPAKITRPNSAKKVYQGRIFNIWQWPQELYDGRQAVYEMIERTDTVTTLAITKEQKVIVTKQEQPCTNEFFGLPGGVIDQGEEPLAAAKRELLEETGFQAGDWQLWFASQFSGKIDWANYVFVAKDCHLTSEQNLDGGEKIKVLELPFVDYVEIMRQENYRDAEIALRYFRMTADEKENFRETFLSNDKMS